MQSPQYAVKGKTMPANWPSYFPAYHTPKGWEVEKLQAEILIREQCAAKWNLKLHGLMGTKGFYPMFDRIQANYSSLMKLYDKRYEICREAV